MKWQLGDRVTRQVFLDDGTWIKLGDPCLAESPLLHGKVLGRDVARSEGVIVAWDEGGFGRYLDHGLDAETSDGAVPAIESGATSTPGIAPAAPPDPQPEIPLPTGPMPEIRQKERRSQYQPVGPNESPF